MGEMTIGEVARRAGLRPSALRYYEEAGILPAPRRLNGRRRYDPSVVQRLEVVRFARRAGFTLAEIRTLFHGFRTETPFGERWRALAQAKLRELDALVARAAQMRRAIEGGLACGCLRVEDCRFVEDSPDLDLVRIDSDRQTTRPRSKNQPFRGPITALQSCSRAQSSKVCHPTSG